MYLALTVKVRVLPDPGPAITRDGPSTAVICGSLFGIDLLGSKVEFHESPGIDSVVRFKIQDPIFTTSMTVVPAFTLSVIRTSEFLSFFPPLPMPEAWIAEFH